MTISEALRLFSTLEGDRLVQNFIAQARSRFLIRTVGGQRNGPPFTIDDEALMHVGTSYLDVGCNLFRSPYRELAQQALYKGAVVFECLHAAKDFQKDSSKYHILLAGLSFYVSSHYSRAFVVLRDAEQDTELSHLLSLFLKKDYRGATSILNRINLGGEFSDESIAASVESNGSEEIGITDQLTTKVIISACSQAIALLMEFTLSGSLGYLEQAEVAIDSLISLSMLLNDPGAWWVMRLLRLVISGFRESSLWMILPPFIGNQEYLSRYVSSLAFRNFPVTELWISQREALPIVLNTSNRGAVVSFPTSGGKTRVAEIAILHSLSNNPSSKVLYIAPFRTLAYEVEETLSTSFQSTGIEVTHLYGGALFSNMDRALLESASIVIATPEKARAMLRAVPSLLSEFKLIVIDEGHLIGDLRSVANELFFETLRLAAHKGQLRIVLLSAVLPNAEEISTWITGSSSNVTTSHWTVADQQCGLLLYDQHSVKVDWTDNSFIPNFIRLDPRKNWKKQDLIAESAVKLTSFGSVLIFVGQPASTFTYGEAVLKILVRLNRSHEWSDPQALKAFELCCKEAYGSDSLLYKLAIWGIICHSAALPAEVRSSMERLMQTSNPKIVIATTTLSQGVNLGVSSVIIAEIRTAGRLLDHKQFWNLAGRAGRAFVDREGKILVAVDSSDSSQLAWRTRLAESFFDRKKIEPAFSGLLKSLNHIYEIALKANIDFETLLGMVADGGFIPDHIQDGLEDIYHEFDEMDDTLLSLLIERDGNLQEGADYVEECFLNALAVIQSINNINGLTAEQLCSLLSARARAIASTTDRSQWARLISSSLPLRSSNALFQLIPNLQQLAKTYEEGPKDIKSLIAFCENSEAVLGQLPSKKVRYIEDVSHLSEFRTNWFSGNSLQTLRMSIRLKREQKAFDKLGTSYFGYLLPWLFNAVAIQCSLVDDSISAQHFQELAVLAETGVPTIEASRVFAAGIRSRCSATEIALHLSFNPYKLKLGKLRQWLVANLESLQGELSNDALDWMKLLKTFSVEGVSFPSIPIFNFLDQNLRTTRLLIRSLNDDIYLCSPDYTERVFVESSDDFPFGTIANRLDVTIEGSENDTWLFKPRIAPFSNQEVDFF